MISHFFKLIANRIKISSFSHQVMYTQRSFFQINIAIS